MNLTSLPALDRFAPESAVAPSASSGQQSSGFATVVDQLLSATARDEASVTKAVQGLATGQSDDVHTVALAVAQADVSTRLAVEVRNRLLEAYQDVIRLQI